MESLLGYAKANPVVTVIAALVALWAIRWLLNRKPAATRNAEHRVAQLEEANRDHYRQGRTPK